MTAYNIQISVVLLYAVTGFCLFLVFLNRRLILMPDNRFKTPIILSAFLAAAGGGALAGYTLPVTPWIIAPVAMLFLILIGEVRRVRIRRSYAASAPVDTIPHAVELAQPVTTTDLVTHRYNITLPKWHGPAFRIVHITDLHVHTSLPTEYYQHVLDVAEQARPDLTFFTGDFITEVASISRLKQVLRPLGAGETFAVLGNHDYWADPAKVGAAVKGAGLRLLTNESAAIQVQGCDVLITGCDDPWGAANKALPIAKDETPHLVLSHTPDNIYKIAAASADCVFSGHCHAGQIRIPFLGPVVVPSVYGRRFDHGHFVVNGTHLFVASGIGAANPPLRVYCQPDIFVVDVIGPS
jgi:predicted MPP superfamily phosphohydrolase